MSGREFDLVVFGLTGFTGKFVAREVYRLQCEEKRSLKWAAAGRSETKVRTCLEGRYACMTLLINVLGCCTEFGGDISNWKMLITGHQEHVR